MCCFCSINLQLSCCLSFLINLRQLHGPGLQYFGDVQKHPTAVHGLFYEPGNSLSSQYLFWLDYSHKNPGSSWNKNFWASPVPFSHQKLLLSQWHSWVYMSLHWYLASLFCYFTLLLCEYKVKRVISPFVSLVLWHSCCQAGALLRLTSAHSSSGKCKFIISPEKRWILYTNAVIQ